MTAETTQMPAPTGINFLDRQMAAGSGCGEVFGLLGSTGVGCTTLACMIAAEGARREVKQFDLESAGRWTFITSTASAAEIGKKMLSHIGKLGREQFQGSEFITSFAARGASVPDSDLEGRKSTARHILDNGTTHLDLRGDGFKSLVGPAQYIAGKLVQSNNARPIAGVVIDDMSSLVTTYMDTMGQPPEAESRLLREFLKSSRWMAGSLGCPVWVTHKLRGAVGQSHPTAILTHRDAMGCRYFGDHLDTCFVLGNHDRHTGCFQIQCTKAPRGVQTEPAVVRFSQTLETIEEVDEASRDAFLAPRREIGVDVDDATLGVIREIMESSKNASRDEILADRMVRAVMSSPRTESL